jgi:uncharacterized phage protein (TIGR02220 family)
MLIGVCGWWKEVKTMAERRMFAKKITESDAFLDMPASSQALYFHLNMAADDDGFVNNPKKIQRSVGSSDDDMKLLILKSFVIRFESGIIVIKHWKMHNYIQSDRYKPTDYQEEKSLLELKKNKAYTLDVSNVDTNCTQDVSVGKDRLGKDRLGKDRLGKVNNNYIVEQSTTASIKTVVEYLNEKAGTSYKYQSQVTQRHVNARLAEGFTIEDFMTVIDVMVSEWSNDEKMKKYLRPQTLFGTKFESYLNSKPKQVKGKFDDLPPSIFG